MTHEDWYHQLDTQLWLRSDEGAEDQAAFIKRALRLRKGQTILDAPCGNGRIAVHLAAAGLLVAGVDHNPYFIRQAQDRFRDAELEGEFLVADLRELGFVECFHGAVNWGGSFGYFSDEENLEALTRLVRAVRPRGRVLVDQPNREYVLRHFEEERKRGKLDIRNEWNPDTQRVEGEWTIHRRGGKHTFSTSIRLYTHGQFVKLLERAGLEVEAEYGDADGEPYSRSSKRLILVGRKT